VVATNSQLVTTARGVRDIVLDQLRRELVGPGNGLPATQTGLTKDTVRGEEILRPEDSPRMRYGVGVLFPKQTHSGIQEDAPAPDSDSGEGVQVEESEDTDTTLGVSEARSSGRTEPDTEQEVNRANEYLPSGVGLTALIRIPECLEITVKAARYEPMELEGQGWVDRSGTARPSIAWKRIPIEGKVVLTERQVLADGPQPLRPIATGKEDVMLDLHVFVRPEHASGGGSGCRLITFTLLNNTEAVGSHLSDQQCFFQCEFQVRDKDGSECFLEYPRQLREYGESVDDAALDLLYRRTKVFAVGHGCAANWSDGGTHGATWIRTESLPVYDMAPILPSELKQIELSMWRLSDPDDGMVIESARVLCREYEAWISKLEGAAKDAATVPENLRKAANRNLAACRRCLERIELGVELLEEDPLVREAFCLVNRAMAMQQIHYKIAAESIREWVAEGNDFQLERAFEQPDYSSGGNRWHPFQFAFLVMTLRSVALPEDDDREVVDIIWFPTGGGKTEAYLGLTAFEILLRRLRNPRDNGTAALMRYTLRLLTTQQYQRAASLTCALEHIRRQQPERLGEEPITIGLWVGGSVTPNKEAEAAVELQRMLREGGRDNPFVLLSCPWCGARMGAIKTGNSFRCKGYRLLRGPTRVRHICDDPQCEFSTAPGLPVLVVDESIYQNPPSLIIGTVDKFALLPWRPEAAALFGGCNPGDHVPPQLIIQDELHLISGPLGSMVGHYESAVTELCRHPGGAPPKIVGSTATISRAQEQVVGLYAREKSFLFPPQGLEWGKSFFAEERKDLPGRVYVGVFCSALPSAQTALVRVLSSLLQAPALAASSSPVEAVDPYWTLLAYFNSLRELGTTATLVSADIRRYLNVMGERLGVGPRWDRPGEDRRRLISSCLELTSRISRGQISDSMDQLFRRFDGTRGSAVDVCLATNMIQVGLDVPRLGLMVVEGQPKTVSEYIQATSRVGRQLPGLVVTLLNPSKPRDRSHYEHFREFHANIYKWVEPMSVTPFAIPVRERALHAIIIALARYWGAQPVRDYPDPAPPHELLDKIRETILARVRISDPDEEHPTARLLDSLVDEWKRHPAQRYGGFGPQTEEVPFMFQSGSSPLPQWDSRALPTPTSVRNVDATCDAAIIARYIAVGDE
jgi:hypothetical protein